ncbi:MAG: crossover junction endodeoxyribonuclease RuvC [Nitrospirota bacterium]
MRHREKNSPQLTASVSGEARILGIDPGSISCGYGLVETASSPVYISSGRIALSKNPLHLRLKELHDTLIDIIREYKPLEMVVERIFFSKSVRAALGLGQVRGIVFLAAASEGVNVHEYSALDVKKAITGYGKAEKRQVQEMVMRILNLNPQMWNLTEDSADALALALCHLNNLKFREAIHKYE